MSRERPENKERTSAARRKNGKIGASRSPWSKGPTLDTKNAHAAFSVNRYPKPATDGSR